MVELLRRGDIVLVEFGLAEPFEAAARRPAIIISNNSANAVMNTVIVMPLTSNTSRVYPHETFLEVQRSGLDKDSKTQPQLLRHVSIARLVKTLSHLPEDLMQDVDRKLREHLAL